MDKGERERERESLGLEVYEKRKEKAEPEHVNDGTGVFSRLSLFPSLFVFCISPSYTKRKFHRLLKKDNVLRRHNVIL